MNRNFFPKDTWDNARVFVVCGAGGVGKTTVAASLAVALAEKGHRTLVLTVDPAKRLAQSLGLDKFEADVQKIPLPFAPQADLMGSMLDSSRYFDRMMERFAKSEAQKQRILSHPLYRLTVNHLGGTQEYAAMERLLEFAEDKRFDKIVIDTPPTANAMDLFTAPRRMAEFMDGQVVKWFRKESGPFSFFKTGAKLAMKMLQKVFGGSFFDQLAELMQAIEGMEAGFVDRHQRVLDLLSHDSTGVFLVSLPNETRFNESLGFFGALGDFRIKVRGIFLNQMQTDAPPSPAALDTMPEPAKSQWLGWLTHRSQLAEAHRFWRQRFEERFLPLPTVSLPRRPHALAGLNDLRDLSKLLIASETD